MKPICVVIISTLFLVGCVTQQKVWTRDGNFSNSKFNDDKFYCEKESYNIYPINNQLKKIFNDYYTEDANEDSRYEAWSHCMRKKGWYLINKK